jgi:hypothetical protein
MREPWRPLVLAAVLVVTAGIGVATAQTVIVTNAPAGTTVEFVANAATVAPAATEPGGVTRFAANLFADAARTETDARVYVDVCGTVRRVLLVERVLEPPPRGVGCDRKEVRALFVVRRVTTLVVDLAGPEPTVWLRQGSVPAEWLRQGVESDRPAKITRPLPTGLVLGGGGEYVKFRDMVKRACGNVTECSGQRYRPGYNVGAAYWFIPYLAAEVAFLKPADATAHGSGTNYRFDTFLDTQIVTVVGKAGIPIGRIRVYGQAGADYNRATFSTTQTVDATTVTIDGVTQTVPGGTETFEVKTSGWGFVIGGGVEIWVKPRFAIYAEVEHMTLKGAPLAGEGALDEGVTSILFGARIRLRGRR